MEGNLGENREGKVGKLRENERMEVGEGKC